MRKNTFMSTISAAEGAENLEGTTADLEAIDAEVLIGNQRDLEEALEGDIDTFGDAVEVIEESEERVATLEEGLEEMPTEALVGGVAQLEVVAGQVDDMTDSVPSLESITAEPREAVRRSLESISAKLKAAWEKLKQFFRGIWNKIKQLVIDFMLWMGDHTKKIDALKKLANEKGALKEKVDLDAIKKSVGNKLSSLSYCMNGGAFSVPLNKMKAADFKSVADMSPNSDAVLSGAEVNKLAQFYNGLPALAANEYLVLTRFDGSSLKGVICSKDGSNIGYKSYLSVSLTEKSIAGMKISKVLTLDEIKAALTFASTSISSAATAKTVLYKEMERVNKDLSSEVESLKYDQGVFKMIWTKTLGTKSFEQLSAEEKVSYVRNKSSITSRMTFDILFGINGTIKDTAGVCKVMLDQYQGK